MTRNKERVKELGRNLVVAVALRATRAWLNEHLEGVSVSDCLRAIKSNTKLWKSVPDTITDDGMEIVRKHSVVFKRCYDTLTVDLVLQWLQKDRSDLYSIIVNTPGGVEWLDGQLEEIKQSILEKM